jgi:hypothetical protein
MKYLGMCFLLAAATTASAQTPPAKGDNKVVPGPVVLHACVTAGTAKNTFMLSNVIRADQPVGTSGSNRPGANAFYWLDSSSKLKGHVGHLVEISGTLDDDVDQTEVRKTKDGTVEVVSERTKKVAVAEGTNAALTAGPVGSKRLSYKVKVRSVKLLSESCPQ